MSKEVSDFIFVEDLLEKGVKFAVIDVDKTLTHTHPGHLLAYLRNKRFTNRLFWNAWVVVTLMKLPFYYIIDKFSRDVLSKVFFRKYHPFSVEEMETAAREMFEIIIPFTHELVFHLKRKGIHVTLLSQNIEPVIKQYGEYFGVAHYALPVVAEGTRSRVDLANLAGYKERIINTFNPEETIAIGDSIHDFTTLNHVRFPMIICHKKKRWMSQLRNEPLLYRVKG
jgi:phosphoserine phosphatase